MRFLPASASNLWMCVFRSLLIPILFIAASPAAVMAQAEADQDPSEVQPKPVESLPDELPPHVDTHWYNLPLPMLSTTSLPPQVPGYLAKPLSAKEKFKETFVQDTLGPKAIANRFVVAGFHQARNRPDEWGTTSEGYGKRLGYSMARGAMEASFITAFDIAAKADNRYDRCACTGFMSRSAHAWRRVLIIRRDSGGGEIVDGGRLAAAFVAPAISFRMYPSRYYTTETIVSSGFQYLGWRVMTNMIREFWPEIHRKFRIGPHPSER